MNTEEETYRQNIDEKLDLILTQTTKHNGRLTKIEMDAVRIKTRINTSVAILSFLIASILVPLLGAYIATGKL